MEAFRKALTPEVTAAVFTHVSNVFGVDPPHPGAGAGFAGNGGSPSSWTRPSPPGCLPVHLAELGAAFIAMPGHKGLYGPQGTGLLLCGQEPRHLCWRAGTGSESIRQEMPDFLPDRLEAGTHNIAGIAGLLEGLRFVEKQGVQSIGSHERALTVQMGESLAQLPGVEVFRSKDPSQQAGVLSFRVSGMDCEELGEALGRRDIALRSRAPLRPAGPPDSWDTGDRDRAGQRLRLQRPPGDPPLRPRAEADPHRKAVRPYKASNARDLEREIPGIFSVRLLPERPEPRAGPALQPIRRQG